MPKSWFDPNTLYKITSGIAPFKTKQKRYDKADPKYYASLTVSKALQELQRRRAGIAGPEL